MLYTLTNQRRSSRQAGFVAACLGILCPPMLNAQEPPKVPPGGSKQPQPQPRETVATPGWSYELRRKLEKQCQVPSADGSSCFKLPIGANVMDLVPVGEVTDADKSQSRAFWEKILQPEFLPPDPAKVIWRKLQLTKVAWPPAKPDVKGWSPPRSDWVCARWDVAGRPVVAIDQSITLQFAGSDRLRYRHPTREEVGSMATSYLIETQIDKPALLNMLISVFRVPWLTDTDFVVRWSLNSQGPDSLKIRSANFQREADPPAWRDWYDEMAFEIVDGDPQYLTFSFWLPPK